jgi:glycosyltransferase involved in cell wall biosynthesis
VGRPRGGEDRGANCGILRENKIRILYISYADHARPAAASIHVRGVIEGLEKRGHKIALWQVSGCEFPDNISDSSRSFPKTNARDFAIEVGKAILSEGANFDVLYLRDFYLAEPVLDASRKAGLPTVIELNGWTPIEAPLSAKGFKAKIVAHWEKLTFPKKLKLADCAVAVSSQIQKKARELNSELDVHFIPNGVATDLFKPLEKIGIRKELKIPTDKFVVGYIGGMERWHNLDSLLEAISIARFENVFFYFLGDGPEKARLENYARKLGLGNKSVFGGSVSIEESAKYLSAFDLSLVTHAGPIRGLGWPVKLPNSVACGTPVIITESESFKIIVEKNAGVMVATDDAKKIAEAIEKLIANPAQIAGMGVSARKWAVEELDWNIIVEKIEKEILIPISERKNYSK